MPKAPEDESAEQAKIWLEIWKKTVDVQQHFNDLELRIRNYAIVVVGALLGLGGYAIKESSDVLFLGFRLHVSGLIVLMAIIPLLAFYFMDRFWYHRLLDGAVKSGAHAEKKLADYGFDVNLGHEISKASPISWILWGKKSENKTWAFFHVRLMHSKHKMDFFYFSVALAILLVGLILLFSGFSGSQALLSGTPTP